MRSPEAHKSPGSSQDSGMCIWFTGLSGAGKTTTAKAVMPILEDAGQKVTSLDGDEVRQHLSSELGFSKADRDLNVRRIGFVASQIVYHSGIAVCSLISPYRESRAYVRGMMPPNKFIEVYVATSLDVCEQRDTKGHYLKARAGVLPEFTGISDPYQPPVSPELRLDTVNNPAEYNARLVADLTLAKIAQNCEVQQ